MGQYYNPPIRVPTIARKIELFYDITSITFDKALELVREDEVLFAYANNYKWYFALYVENQQQLSGVVDMWMEGKLDTLDFYAMRREIAEEAGIRVNMLTKKESPLHTYVHGMTFYRIELQEIPEDLKREATKTMGQKINFCAVNTREKIFYLHKGLGDGCGGSLWKKTDRGWMNAMCISSDKKLHNDVMHMLSNFAHASIKP